MEELVTIIMPTRDRKQIACKRVTANAMEMIAENGDICVIQKVAHNTQMEKGPLWRSACYLVHVQPAGGR
jgi:hypothetical protein